MFRQAWKHLLLIVPVLVLSCVPAQPGTAPMHGGTSMITTELKTYQVRHVSVTINRSPQDVYSFVSDPGNLPKWATVLGGSIRYVNGEWVADSPMGKIRIKFAEKNTFGILDHEVVLESGVKIDNPMRSLPMEKAARSFLR